MNLKEEYLIAKDSLENKFNCQGSYSMFETTIRILGGLLSVYDLTGDDAFLKKLKHLEGRCFQIINKILHFMAVT
jgi:mannosyl-oligosaccharide alpha-1,2-mannosidase